MLVLHPSMYQNVQAQTEPEYDFSRHVGSITPELEPEGYGLNPFYAGRPLYDPYSATMDNALLIFIGVLALGYKLLLGIASFLAVAYLIYQAARVVWDGINWLIEMKYRDYFKNWLVNIVQQYGPIGATECAGKERRGQEFVDCIDDEHKKLFRAFTNNARKCEGGRWEGR